MTNRTATTAAIILSLTAVGAPAASASTKAAGTTASAYAAPTLIGKPYAPAPRTGKQYAPAPTLTGRQYAPAGTLTGTPHPASPTVGASADHQSAGNATAVHRSGGATIWALIGLGVAGIALFGAGAAASRRPSRRTARARAFGGS